MKTLKQAYLMLLALPFCIAAAGPIGAAEITVDGSACTLGEAITSANNDSAGGNGCVDGSGEDTIILETDVTLAAALPQISSTITIEGGDHFISGNNDPDVGSVLHITDTGNLTLNKATITEGTGDKKWSGSRSYGGGIYNEGTVTLSNSTVSGNSAEADSDEYDDVYAYGGGIYNEGIVTLNNSTVSDNSSASTSAYLTFLYGGGIYNKGMVTLTNSTISGNSAEARAHSDAYAYGGGMYNQGTVTLNNSTVSGNSTDANSSNDDAYAYGGGIYNEGTVTLNDSTVSDNSSFAHVSRYTYGAGIYNKGTVTLNNSTVSDNAGETDASSSSYGGGIYNEGIVTLTNSTVSDNSAKDGGGGIYNLDTITLTNSTVSGNSVKDSAFIDWAAHAYGGGIYNEGTVTLINSTVSGNLADASAYGRGAYSYGGGIYNEGTITLTNSTVSGNSAAADSLYDSTYARGGAIYNEGTVTLSNSTVSGNSTNADSSYDNAYTYGGGICNWSGTITLNNALISGNSAGEGNEIYIDLGEISSDNYNLFGHSGESNTDAFVGFTPVGTDVDATGDDGSALEDILSPLADNGGPTWTHALPEGSPAIDLAECSDDLTTDQRSYPRPSGDGCDAGSFELVLDNLTLAIETLQDTAAAVNTLVPSVFKGKNNRKNFTNGLNEALTLLEEGLYTDALQKLEGGSILGKTDGCTASEPSTPDRNDWIQNCDAQEQVYPLIIKAIEYLEGMI